MACPGEREIVDFVGGRLAADDAAAIESHIDACSACRRLVSELARDLPSLPDSDSSGPTEPMPTPIPAPPARRAPAIGTPLGRYVVLSKLGEGGMGVVYAAFDPELNRKVAVKLLSAPLATAGEGRDRLLREAKAMARLSHPNVVTVYDVGNHDGQLFIAMELVEGTTIGRWLKDRPHRPRETLDVFLQAGRGLAAAHESGLVHRDFKPDNVLLGPGGRVCVTDFGLARLVEESQPAAGLVDGERSPGQLTLTGALVGTPAYMAPEQHRHGSVDERADQFSYCVALYEALYGQRPFAGKNVRELGEAIGKGLVPPPPQGSRVPARLRRVLLRGLEVDPQRRYPSMDALLAALAPRTRAFWRAAGLGAAIAVAAAGVALAVVSLRGQGRLLCKGAERELAGVWDPARKGAVHAAFQATGAPYAESAWRRVEQVLDGYTRDWAAMHADACEATRVRGEQSEEMLDLRMECLERRRKDVVALVDVFARADAQAAARAAEAVAGLDDLSLCADRAALRSGARGRPGPEKRVQVALLESKTAQVKALTAAGRYKDALPLAREAADAARALGYRPLEARALDLLGSLQCSKGDEGCLQTLRDAIAAGEAGGDDAIAVETRIDLMLALRDRGATDEALAVAGQADAIIERMGGSPLRSAWVDLNRGAVYVLQGKYPEAEAAFRKALDAYEQRQPNSMGTVRALEGVASVYFYETKAEESIAAFERAISIAEQLLGPDHPEIARTLSNLGAVLAAFERYDAAVPYLRRSIEIQERSIGPDSPLLVAPLQNLAEVLNSKGATGEALGVIERALAISEKAHRQDQATHARMLVVRSDVLQSVGRAPEALADIERARAVFEKTEGPGHRDVAMSFDAAAQILEDEKRYGEALAYSERAVALYEKALGKDSIELGNPLTRIGAVYVTTHEAARALAPLERALRLREANDVAPTAIADTRYHLAAALWDTGGDAQRARSLAEKAVAAYAQAGEARRESLNAARALLDRHRPR